MTPAVGDGPPAALAPGGGGARAGHRGDAARCRELGISAYLLKPIRQSELRESIARVLGAGEQKGAIPLVTRYSLHDAREPGAILRVLLAEDNVVNQRLMVRLLEKRGHRVVVVANGREALQEIEKESFDLILMDVQMPEMDGLEASAVIRRIEADTGAHIPIMAITANAFAEDREQCLQAGMDDFLTKPIRAEELYAAMDRMAHRSTPPERERGTSLRVCDRSDEREPVLTSGLVQEGSEP